MAKGVVLALVALSGIITASYGQRPKADGFSLTLVGNLPQQGLTASELLDKYDEAVELPTPIKQVRPTYSPQARRNDLTILFGLTRNPGLAKAALDAALQWTFTPAKAKGDPTEAWVIIPLVFRRK